MADAPPMILAQGRYWFDVAKDDPKQYGTWQGFLSAFKEFIHVEVTDDSSDESYRPFYIFTTSKDLVWPDGIGHPTIAGAEIKSRADTVQRPDPEKDVTDQIPSVEDVGKGIATAANTLVWIIGIGIAAAVLLHARSKR